MRQSLGGRSAIVYQAVNTANGKRYVGVTSQYLCHRKAKHFRQARLGLCKGSIFYKAIRKYGRENFVFSVVAEFGRYEDALREEVRLIAETKPEYNVTAGGDGALGYKHTPEMCAEISRRNKGRPSYWKGKKVPDHVAELSRQRNAVRTDKAWILPMGPKSIQRRTVCLNDGRVFDSVRLAAQAYGIQESSVSTVCKQNTNRKTVAGLVFRFFGDHEGGAALANKIALEAKKNQYSSFEKGRAKTKRKVVCVEDGRTFDSAIEASRFYGIDRSHVHGVLRGYYGHRSAHGKTFRYAEGA